MSNNTWTYHPEHDDEAKILFSSDVSQHFRHFSGQFDLDACTQELGKRSSFASEFEAIVYSLIYANYELNQVGFDHWIKDISEHTTYVRFFDTHSEGFPSSKSEFWVRIPKRVFQLNNTTSQCSMLIQMISHALRSFLSDKEDTHPLLLAYLNTHTPSQLSIAHRKFVINELSFYLLGEKGSIHTPKAPAPWSSQFLLFSAGNVFETCQTIISRSDMAIWSKYVHTNVLSISKELIRDFPFSPWGEKLFFYYHLLASGIGPDGKKTLMTYWKTHAGIQPEICILLNSAWRNLNELLENQSSKTMKKELADSQIKIQLNSSETKEQNKAYWSKKDSYKASNIEDIDQFIRDLSRLKIDKKPNSLNLGRFFSSEN